MILVPLSAQDKSTGCFVIVMAFNIHKCFVEKKGNQFANHITSSNDLHGVIGNYHYLPLMFNQVVQAAEFAKFYQYCKLQHTTHWLLIFAKILLKMY